MSVQVGMVFAPSQEIVARLIEDELIIVPLSSGIGDLEDELFTLNETGKAIWFYLDGKNSIEKVISYLAVEFDASPDEITKDVLGLIEELVKRKIIIEIRNPSKPD